MNRRILPRGYAAVGLDNPKTPINVGQVLRALGCFGSSLLAISGNRAADRLNSIPTDVNRQWRRTPLLRVEDLKDVIPYACVPVAVDLVPEAQSLQNYKHPERAFYIFGAEDAILGERVLSWCRDTIYIPTNYCMNLAATVNVVLYDRMVKQKRRTNE